MLQELYKVITSNGFTSKGQDRAVNKQLNIKRSFTNELGHYIEVYKEIYGFSVLLYGGDFMNDYSPMKCDILFKKDIESLRKKIETTLA